MSSNKNARYNRFSSGTTNITTSENTNGVRLGAVGRARGLGLLLMFSPFLLRKWRWRLKIWYFPGC